MPAKINLTVTEGPLTGKEFGFEGPAICTVGRANDCYLRLPSEEGYLNVSRHHCWLDIDPPNIRVRDLGSMNGTYVNGVKIGQRQQLILAEEVDIPHSLVYRLKDGDRLRVGETVFRVDIYRSLCCADCGGELEESESDSGREPARCSACSQRAAEVSVGCHI
jgi:serine/threonine-protein kinase